MQHPDEPGSLNFHVYLRRELLPSTELWAHTIRRSGLPLVIEEGGFPLEPPEPEGASDPHLIWIGAEEEPTEAPAFALDRFEGPLACAYRGLPAKVLLWWEPIDPRELPYGFRARGEDLCTRLVHYGGERDILAALSIAATLAKAADGQVHTLANGQILQPDQAYALVRQLADDYGLDER